MFLASAYLGGIVFFVNVLRPNLWHRVRHGFPAVLVFATLLSIATFLHWDRFHPGHISFIVWVTLYVVTPFLVLGVIILNRGQDPRVPDERDYALPLVVRVVLAVIGLCALVAGLFLFFSPQQTIDVWAWPLTPLTARVAGAVLTLPGMVNVWMLWDARWSAFRWVFQAQLASLVFIVAALGIRHDDLLWERPSTALFVGGMIFSLVAYAAFYVWCDARARALRAARCAASSQSVEQGADDDGAVELFRAQDARREPCALEGAHRLRRLALARLDQQPAARVAATRARRPRSDAGGRGRRRRRRERPAVRGCAPRAACRAIASVGTYGAFATMMSTRPTRNDRQRVEEVALEDLATRSDVRRAQRTAAGSMSAA